MAYSHRARVIAITVGFWAVGVAVREALRIVQALTGPASPELYTNHLVFQLIASGLLIVRNWLPLLVLVLMAQWLGLSVRNRLQKQSLMIRADETTPDE
jgi:hypothetical protein